MDRRRVFSDALGISRTVPENDNVLILFDFRASVYRNLGLLEIEDDSGTIPNRVTSQVNIQLRLQIGLSNIMTVARSKTKHIVYDFPKFVVKSTGNVFRKAEPDDLAILLEKRGILAVNGNSKQKNILGIVRKTRQNLSEIPRHIRAHSVLEVVQPEPVRHHNRSRTNKPTTLMTETESLNRSVGNINTEFGCAQNSERVFLEDLESGSQENPANLPVQSIAVPQNIDDYDPGDRIEVELSKAASIHSRSRISKQSVNYGIESPRNATPRREIIHENSPEG